ncbi:RNA polymerase sporulation sigma factor SigH [[Clostridium] colinum]|uniref:RNA polymerase sporulation sigma factor SigH n=1 Tax=[Clostridium] colinum TaxID=36835 RepID=UPI0020248409|nr:RNA polymerase sporulation sigma factor SigH [[Clostridium] colinum]
MYENYTDEELLDKIKNGDNIAMDYLITKYKNLVKMRARAYFIIGTDSEDIMQEGMIGLYKAIRDYKKTDASFQTFAKICIDRQVITAIKMANRKKHLPLNSYLSLNMLVYEEDSEITYIDKLEESKALNPEEIVIDKENVKTLQKQINEKLSKLEKQVLKLYLRGKSYATIAKELQKDEKSIDNAIQRIRKKIEKIQVSKC